MSPLTAPGIASLCALATAALISGCGGGEADPVKPRVPVAAQPSNHDPSAFGPMGLTDSQDLATLGFAYRYTINSDGSDGQGPPAPDSTEAIRFRYLSAEQSYEIELPGVPSGRLVPISADSTHTTNRLSPSPNPNLFVVLFRPGPENKDLSLVHTSFGSWSDATYTFSTRPEERRTENQGLFAYGVPTAAGDVPTSGDATYRALAWGLTSVIDGRSAFAGGAPGYIEGDALLVIDFSSGGLTGRIRLGLNDGNSGSRSVGEFQPTDFVHSAGATAFAGRFAVSGSDLAGTFEGVFTGPQAAEVMVRWKAPFRDPVTNVWGTMFGIWVGKK